MKAKYWKITTILSGVLLLVVAFVFLLQPANQPRQQSSGLTADQIRPGPTASAALTLKGRLLIELYGPSGELIEKRQVENIVLEYGKEAALVELFSGQHPLPLPSSSFNPFTYLAVGGSDGTPVDSTLLAQELFRLGRVSVPVVDVTSNCISQSFARGTTANAETYKEAGLATYPTANWRPLLNRVTFPAITKAAGGSTIFSMQICIT